MVGFHPEFKSRLRSRLFSKNRPLIAARDIDRIAEPGNAKATGKPQPKANAIVNIRMNKKSNSIILALF